MTDNANISTSVSDEFLIIAHAKNTDAAKAAEASGLSVKYPISKRIVVASLSGTYKAITNPAVEEVLTDINDPAASKAIHSQPPVANELFGVFSAGDDRAILMTGLDADERQQVSAWRKQQSPFPAV